MRHTLSEAREYEERAEKSIHEKERPVFHLSPRTGWMNDPNGFSFYKGEYHLFYQYYPYEPYWGPMHWGHAVSKDLIRWEYLPAALAPDRPYDKDGCFSGGAVALPDGRQLLMYTAVRRVEQEDGSFRDEQTQCLAIGDGRDYEKYENNPVLDEKDIPEGCSKADFRDPKLWKNPDGSYQCLVVNRAADGSGQILLYSSPDGFSWAFQCIVKENRHRFGVMWECPDMFRIDGKFVLICSPMDMLAEGWEFENGNGTIGFVGGFDDKAGCFLEEGYQALDYGIDFYAPQTVYTPDGRVVMIAWMQNWDTSRLHGPETPWFGQMTTPRELYLREGRIIQKPIRELESLRCNRTAYSHVELEGGLELEGIRGRSLDLEIEIAPAQDQPMYREFALRFAQDSRFYTEIQFRPYESVLRLNRRYSGTRRAAHHQRECQIRRQEGRIKLRLLLDRFSAEIFINDGEQVMTTTIYTDIASEGISFVADGQLRMELVKYDLVKTAQN